jgi:hypothetical protein
MGLLICYYLLREKWPNFYSMESLALDLRHFAQLNYNGKAVDE